VDKAVDRVAARVAVNRVDNPAMTSKAAAKKPAVAAGRKVVAAAPAVAVIDKRKQACASLLGEFYGTRPCLHL
jgi:hypothetical protein